MSKVKTHQLQSKPAFRARRSSARNVSSAFINMNAQTVDYDVNGDYDNVTNFRFVAPVAGIYSFQATVYADSATSPRVIISWGVTGTGASDAHRTVDTDATEIRRENATWEGYLPAGGTIYPSLWSEVSIDINSSDTTFAGHLVTEYTKPA